MSIEEATAKREHAPDPAVRAAMLTVDVTGAAALLHTTVGAIYVRRARGKMPRPMTRRPLVWRTADVLAMAEDGCDD